MNNLTPKEIALMAMAWDDGFESCGLSTSVNVSIEENHKARVNPYRDEDFNPREIAEIVKRRNESGQTIAYNAGDL